MFGHVKIILINTTHPGNIGAVARAMKNMGFHQLCLVSPKHFPSEEAVARASGAEDILNNASVVRTLEEALAGSHFVFGLSSRMRRIPWQTLTVRMAADQIKQTLQETPNLKIALLFGQEQSGLLNEELERCHYQITIPANPEYASLNLAQAVQIMTYELRLAFLGGEKGETGDFLLTNEDLTTSEEMEGFYTHLSEVLQATEFLDPKNPGFLMTYLRRLYGRTRVTKLELNILRGMLTAIKKSV